MPLAGKRIVVTSAGDKGKDFAAQLNKLGAQAYLAPMIEINDPDSWEQLDRALANLHSYNWLFFASSNAVGAFVKRLVYNQSLEQEKTEAKNTVIKLPDNSAVLPAHVIKKLPPVAVIGQRTAEAAMSYGIVPKYYPNNYLAEDFIAKFPGYPNDLAGTNILWPRTNIGRDLILEKLLDAQAKVIVVPAYKSDFPAQPMALYELLQTFIGNKASNKVAKKEKTADNDSQEQKIWAAITIGSKQTALNLAKILCLKQAPNDISRNLLSASFPTAEDLLYLEQLLADILIVTIGPEASAGALNYLGKVNLEAKPHTVDGMINALIEYYRRC